MKIHLILLIIMSQVPLSAANKLFFLKHPEEKIEFSTVDLSSTQGGCTWVIKEDPSSFTTPELLMILTPGAKPIEPPYRLKPSRLSSKK